ncbi:MAG: hypothetical protein ACTHN0_05260 [Aquihabitans sp.]
MSTAPLDHEPAEAVADLRATQPGFVDLDGPPPSTGRRPAVVYQPMPETEFEAWA